MIDPLSEPLIPILDALKIVPVSEITLRKWVESGQLETVSAGGDVFTSRQAVLRMLQPGPEPVATPTAQLVAAPPPVGSEPLPPAVPEPQPPEPEVECKTPIPSADPPWETCDYNPATCYGVVGAFYPEDIDIMYEEYEAIGVFFPEEE